MKNFDFIKKLAEIIPDFAQLHEYCDKAEIFQSTFPEESASNARKALEWLVKNHLSMANVTLDPYETLSQMIKRPQIDTFINDDWNFEQHMRTVKKIGNYASHIGSQPVRKNDAFVCLRALYYVVSGFLFRWQAIKEITAFDATLVPTGFSGMHVAEQSEPTVSLQVVDSVPAEAIEHPKAPEQEPKESLASEAITRKCLIDYMLNEAKWEILNVKGDIQGGKAAIEVKIDGMDKATYPSGVGYADYVLYSKGGKPLAVIEAKSTIQNADKGRKQAMEYADGLEKKHGVRPVIYYTNGYETKVIDGLGYRDREVISFHSEDDLERMIQKRGRADITDLTIDDEITNRPYQKTAIKSLVEWLNKKHRRGLLVLATGTGKTRVSISLCKLLSNNNWIKKVLFLADRTELVNQAHGKFEEFLPSESMSCLSEDTDPDLDARFIFSTYQTMINYINAVPVEFSVGHFDLIIIDEAHRSVFGKYGAIFQYFDSLLIGLTATPRAEIDKNTFKLLELENAPNYEYTYDEGDENVRTRLFAVHDRGEDGVAGECCRGIDDVALHELDRLRVKVGQLDLRHGGDGGLHVGKREDEAHVHFRLRDELERQLRDDAERALRADHQVQQAVAGAGLAHGLAELHDSAVGQHHGHGQHVVARDAVLHGAHAARVRGHVAAHGRGLFARVGRVHQAVRERVGREVAQQHAGLDVHDEVVHVIGEDLVHARRAQHHAAAQRHASADEARARAARRDGNVVIVAHAQNCGHFLGALGLADHLGVILAVDGHFVVAEVVLHRVACEKALRAHDGLKLRGDLRRDLIVFRHF